MVQLLLQNFDQLTDLENQISTFCEDNEKSYPRDVLLSHFFPVFKEVPLSFSTLVDSVDLFLDASVANSLCLGFLESDLRKN